MSFRTVIGLLRHRRIPPTLKRGAPDRTQVPLWGDARRAIYDPGQMPPDAPKVPPPPPPPPPPPGTETKGSGYFSGPKFWTGPFLIGTGLLVAVLLGVGWYILGGFPGDHDEYGEVKVPGAQVLSLPEGEVRLNFETRATQSGDSSILDDQPEDLDVRITPARGGDEVEVEDVPSWLFSSTVDDRGHEPWGKADIPMAGDYLVEATASEYGGFKSKPDSAGSARSMPPSIDSGEAISVGKAPWTPFDSALAGAILVFGIFMAITLATSLIIRRFAVKS
jgi:hypothetical protein